MLLTISFGLREHRHTCTCVYRFVLTLLSDFSTKAVTWCDTKGKVLLDNANHFFINRKSKNDNIRFPTLRE